MSKEQSTLTEMRNNQKSEEFVQDLPEVKEQDNEGSQTSTPARPESDNPQIRLSPAKPQNSAEQEVQKMSRFLRNSLIVVGIMVFLLIIGLIIVAIMFSLRPKYVYPTIISTSVMPLAVKNARLKTTTLEMKDPETLNSNAALKLQMSQVDRIDSKGRRLQEDKENSPVLTIQQEITNTTITIYSQNLQMKVRFDVTSALQAVLNRQDFDIPEQRNLQQLPNKGGQIVSSSKELTFQQIPAKVYESIRKELAKIDKYVRIDQGSTVDLEYSLKSESFVAASSSSTSVPPQINSAPLFNASQVPKIQNISNQTQVAEAIGATLLSVVKKCKELVAKRLPDIEKASGVKLPQEDPSDGLASIYLNEPGDSQKICAPLGENKLKCDSRIFQSTAINVDVGIPAEGDQPVERLSFSAYLDA